MSLAEKYLGDTRTYVMDNFAALRSRLSEVDVSMFANNGKVEIVK